MEEQKMVDEMEQNQVPQEAKDETVEKKEGVLKKVGKVFNKVKKPLKYGAIGAGTMFAVLFFIGKNSKSEDNDSGNETDETENSEDDEE